jgi:hypothetical protein
MLVRTQTWEDRARTARRVLCIAFQDGDGALVETMTAELRALLAERPKSKREKNHGDGTGRI